MDKKDFFISYNHNDEGWAEWIAYQLEEAGYQVLFQKWDMGPGSNFVHEMQRAAAQCERTIIVLSPHFLSAEYTQPEWAQAFARDPTGEKRLLIPVRVAECELEGFFKPLVYIDFFPLCIDPPKTESAQRELIRQLRHRLLEGVKRHRRKPDKAPSPPFVQKRNQRLDEAFLQMPDPQPYLQWLSEKIKNVDIFRLARLVGGEVSFPIDQIYTPLKINPRDLRPGQGPEDRIKDDEIRGFLNAQKEPRELGEVLRKLFELERYRCMIVLGRPGSGKTTLLKYIGYFYANRRQREIEDSLEYFRAPFYIRLKDVVAPLSRHRVEGRGGDASLAEVIASVLVEQGCSLSLEKSHIEAWLVDGALVLLDGLDEVADRADRDRVAAWLRGVVEVNQHTYFIISSRLYGFSAQYAPGTSFPVEVDDFDDTQRRRFLHLWFGHLYRYRQDGIQSPRWEPEHIAGQLDEAIAASEHVQDLARNPLMLSMIALVRLDYLESGQGEDSVLPDNRNTLYERSVALFVNQWQEKFEWDGVRELNITKPAQSKVLIRLLEQAALLLQKGQSASTDEPSQIGYGYLIDHLDTTLSELDPDTIACCLQHSHERTLLLVEQKLDSWGFQHKTFQEYLCAEAIVHDPGNLDILVEHLGEDHWRVVFDLFVEGQTQDGGYPNPLLERFLQIAGQRFAEDSTLAGRGWYWLEGLYERDSFHYPALERNRLHYNAWQGLIQSDNPLVLAKFHNFAAKGLSAVRLNETRSLQRLDKIEENQQHLVHHILLLPELFPQVGRALRQRLQNHLDDTLPVSVRGAAALALKRLGEFEPEVLNLHLFVPIAAGAFYRGRLPGEQGARDNEIDGDKYQLDAFEIARFPVTNAEYLQFMVEKKHRAPRFWEEGEYPYGQGNHPVVGVSWYDAQAYVEWLNELEDGHRYFLPTEAQWERGARGPALWQGWENRRRYPWGDEFEPHKCNVRESGLGRTTAVGFLMDSTSPEGVLDMAGNVWEWCADWYDEKYYEKKTVEENKEKADYKVLRGGSFDFDGGNARCACRDHYHPDYDGDGGFRVARI